MNYRITYRVIPLISVVALALSCRSASFAGGGSKKQTVVVNQPNSTQNVPQPVSTPQVGPANQVSQPNPNTVVYGKDQVFHIGDGRFENTSCKDQVSSLPLTGNAYFFQFEVLTDNTQVTVNVAKACGIDYVANTYELYAGYSRLQGQYLTRGMTGVSAQPLTLKKGLYSVILTSGRGQVAGEISNDYDDYLVGQVTVVGSQPIKNLQYGAYNR